MVFSEFNYIFVYNLLIYYLVNYYRFDYILNASHPNTVSRAIRMRTRDEK